jgi:hypothetical protein
MSKVVSYREILRQTDDWEEYLLRECGLPGPRANIELAHAVVEEGNAELFDHLLSFDATVAPANTPNEFLAFCGTLGQGKLLENGEQEAMVTLRSCANDPRWRIREAAAMALQRYGRSDMESLLSTMDGWSDGTLLERRAAAAGLCEPALLAEYDVAVRLLQLLDRITQSIVGETLRRSEEFKALSKGLSYCWSVAVAAQPEIGKPFMEKWMIVEDPDIRRIMKGNLKKKRLQRADAEWTTKWTDYLK